MKGTAGIFEGRLKWILQVKKIYFIFYNFSPLIVLVFDLVCCICLFFITNLTSAMWENSIPEFSERAISSDWFKLCVKVFITSSNNCVVSFNSSVLLLVVKI